MFLKCISVALAFIVCIVYLYAFFWCANMGLGMRNAVMLPMLNAYFCIRTVSANILKCGNELVL